jgi:hypothetical protein
MDALVRAHGDSSQAAIYNHACEAFNHGFFFKCLAPAHVGGKAIEYMKVNDQMQDFNEGLHPHEMSTDHKAELLNFAARKLFISSPHYEPPPAPPLSPDFAIELETQFGGYHNLVRKVR